MTTTYSPPAAASAPREALLAMESKFRTFDGVELSYRAWLPSMPAHKAVILFHRGHEHSGRLAELAESLGLRDTAIFAWDARGHGRSPGARGYADSFMDVVRDADCFVKHVSKKYDVPVENMVVLGHSVGAVTVAAWVHDYAPPVRAMVLATPALRVKLYVPLAMPVLRMRRKMGPNAFVTSYVRSRMLTHDANEAAKYDADPLISKQISVNVLLDVHDTSARLVKDAAAIYTPTLMLTAGNDWVVRNSTSREFFERLSSPVKVIKEYPGFGHAVFHETGRERVVSDVREFITRAFRSPLPEAGLLATDPMGPSYRSYARLNKPLPAHCPRNASFAVPRVFLKTIGKLSAGIRLGWQRGFDSGPSLDHVYRNTPAGVTPLGRLIDRVYLNTPGWRGIRQRKVYLEQTLGRAVGAVRAAGLPVRIVDIASGPGRYLLDALVKLPERERVSVVMRDRDEAGLRAGSELAKSMGLTNVTYERGDAFDRRSLASILPRPTVVIVSGLYELFPDNGPAMDSLNGLAAAVAPGGFLIYTNQPWHPQLEMIARVLTNRDGKPWVMRCRSQGEMDALVRAAGFEKVGMAIDDAGIFTVSVARRV